MSNGSIRKLAVLTSGGDSPGMNAAIYGFAASAILNGYEVYGVVDGYKGFIGQNFRRLDLKEIRRNVSIAGTCIGSSRCLEFKQPEVRKASVEKFKAAGFSGLFVIGGDGSYMGANFISELGCPVVSAPGTIDNDVSSSLYTIGYFSALEEIYQCVLKVKATSESHSQVTFVEVMGRHCHDLSVASSAASAADFVITNKSVKSVEEITNVVKGMIDNGKKGIVILVTEKVFGDEFGFGLPSLSAVCKLVEEKVGRQVRHSVLGYIQRGATPTA